MAEKENIITKTYDLLLYMIPQLSKLPRDHKFLIGDRIENLLLDFLESMIEAYYSRDKLGLLAKGNLQLERLRYLVRLVFDLKLINGHRYELICTQVNEIGAMLGGWKKAISVKT